MVKFSHLYLKTGKTIAWTIWIFVSKVMPLVFNMLSRFVIDFLPRSKCLSISWLQSIALNPVILEPSKIKSVTVSVVSPFICREVIDWMPECWVLSQLFHPPLWPLSRGSSVPLRFQGGVICISEVTDISQGSLDSSLCFIQPDILHDVLWI